MNKLATILVTTLDSIENKYSIRQYSSAKEAHILHNTLGIPEYIEVNMIPNCNITKQDILYLAPP